MGKPYEGIEGRLEEFIERQHLFFVATAPLSGDGMVNLSPKGLDTFRILDPQTVAYVDLAGSGIETVSHIRENGRIVLMFCAFEGPPKIVRIHGSGEVLEPSHPDFDDIAGPFQDLPNIRSVIRIHCQRISHSCGFGVPRFTFDEDRSQLFDWAQRKTPEEVRAYKVAHNSESLDGLPGLEDPAV